MILLNHMYILLILFFASLVSIAVMIGRKLVLLKNGSMIVSEEIPMEIPYVKELRHITIKNIKKYGHMSVVTTLRMYIRSSHILKKNYQNIKEQVKERIAKSRINNTSGEKREVNKFLKMVGDYKHKIREIKHKIKEEENL